MTSRSLSYRKKRLSKKERVAAIVPAAGGGVRLKSKTPKPFIVLNGVPLVVLTLKRLKKSYDFTEIIVPVHPSQIRKTKKLLDQHRLKSVRVIAGGVTRAQSVRHAIDALDQDYDYVLIHDVARPFISSKTIHPLMKCAKLKGAALLAQASVATVKQTKRASLQVSKTLDRKRIYLAQTPQVFSMERIQKAYRFLKKRYLTFTDEASMVEAAGQKVWIVEGPSLNLKITTPEDLLIAKALLRCKIDGF